MTPRATLRTAVCAAALFTGHAAFADVTATQVWESWKADFASYGYDGISVGSEVMDGSTLTVADATVTLEDSLSSVTIAMGDIVFNENGDGTVTVTMAEDYPVTVTSDDGANMAMTITQKGLEIAVSGTPEQLDYAVSADSYGVVIDEIVEDGETVAGDMRVVMNSLSGTYSTSGDALRTTAYDMAAASIDLLFDVKEPGGAGYVVFSGKINDFTTKATGNIPTDVDVNDPKQLFTSGFAIDGNYSVGGSSYVFDVDMDGEKFTGSAQSGAGGMTFGMDGTSMAYDGGSSDLAVTFQSAALPFPIDLAAREYGFGFAMPLAKTDEPAPFGTKINLVDLTINDEVWSMIDPGAALPRDPATLSLDLTGTAKLFYDIYDPEQSEAMAMAPVPGELHSVVLNALNLSAAGAAITGVGSFVFDNTDLATFGGVPRPEGRIDFEINGANALLDKLVTMGLLPEEQAMPARMMMGMFARTVGDDQLTSSIEVNSEGHVLANGQRIQ